MVGSAVAGHDPGSHAAPRGGSAFYGDRDSGPVAGLAVDVIDVVRDRSAIKSGHEACRTERGPGRRRPTLMYGPRCSARRKTLIATQINDRAVFQTGPLYLFRYGSSGTQLETS
jgi:hypothetical protein